MKKKISIVFTALLMIMAVNGFSQTVEEALKQTFDGFDSIRAYNQELPLVNQFKLIAAKWPENWAANYYAAYSITITSFSEPDSKKKDGELDEAESYFNKVLPLASTNQEVNILGALLAEGRMGAHPMAYKKYGGIKDKYIADAKAMNPDNPRIYLLEGDSKYYTPKMFGGGPKNALPFYEKAQTLFANEQRSDIMKPYWGKPELNYMLAKCQEGDKK